MQRASIPPFAFPRTSLSTRCYSSTVHVSRCIAPEKSTVAALMKRTSRPFWTLRCYRSFFFLSP